MAWRERGQVLPLVALVIVVAGLVCLAAGKLGGAAVARAQAVTAADAAALAGAAAGEGEARRAAAANGGRLTGYQAAGNDARVEVELGPAQAAARARRSGGGPDDGPAQAAARARRSGGGPDDGLAPALQAALARAAQLLGGPVPTVPPAIGVPQPGDAATRHRRGLAVDVAASAVARLAPMASQAGLCRPYPGTHPTHFQLCPPAG